MRFQKGDLLLCVKRASGLENGAVYTFVDCYEDDHDEKYRLINVAEFPNEPFFAFRFRRFSQKRGRSRRLVAPKNRSRVDAGPSWGVR